MAQKRRKPVARKPAARKPAPKKTVVRRTVITQKTQESTDYADIMLKFKKTLKGDHVTILESPWEARSIILNLGAKLHNGLKVVIHHGGVLPPQLEPYRSVDFSWERWIEDDLNTSPRVVELPTNKMRPRPHQQEAIKKIVASAQAGWRGFILADNVGVGKTISAIIGASLTAKVKGFTEKNKANLLIIAPKSVLPHWRNTVKATGVNNLRVLIVNYEQAKKLLNPPASANSVKKTSTKNAHTADRGTPAINWDIIIADESHKLKNVSQRSALFSRIARYGQSNNRAPFLIWSSATIGQTPLELSYLAPLIGQMNGIKLTNSTWGDWLMVQNFSIKKSKAGNFSWVKAPKDATPDIIASTNSARRRDVQRLSEMLFNPQSPSIRRNPEQISNWPKQTHIPTPQVLEPSEIRLYREAWNQFRSYMNLTPRGKNPKGGLAATLRFRQKVSLIRAIHTAEFANDLLDNGNQVIISVEFMETIDTLKEYLQGKGWHVAEFSGRNVNERENERLRFQKGEAQVIISTVKEGVSFHTSEQLPDGTKASSAKRDTLIHDVRYSGLDITQIIGRGTREGQLANAYYMYAEGTVETQILSIVLDKVRNMRILSADEEETVNEIESLLDTVKPF